MFHSQIMKSVMTPAVNKIKEKGASILGSMLKRTADLSYFQSQRSHKIVEGVNLQYNKVP